MKNACLALAISAGCVTPTIAQLDVIYLVTDSNLRCANLGDLNNDCVLNIHDFTILINSFGPTDPCSEAADLTGDGYVDIFDLQVMIHEFSRN